MAKRINVNFIILFIFLVFGQLLGTEKSDFCLFADNVILGLNQECPRYGRRAKTGPLGGTIRPA